MLVLFVAKQGFDVMQEWQQASVQMSAQNQAKSDFCLKEYNDKLCNQGKAP